MREFESIVKVCKLRMGKEETSMEEFYKYLYDNVKTRKWFNVYPVCWFAMKDSFFDVGNVTKIYFSMLPFCYGMKCREILPDNRGMLLDIVGPLEGSGRIELIEDDEGILLYHELKLVPKSKFIEKYYSVLVKGHDKFMSWRLGVLRKYLIKEHKMGK